MTKYIGVMIVWIIAAGVLLYVVQHSADLLSGSTSLVKGWDPKGLFESINQFFK